MSSGDEHTRGDASASASVDKQRMSMRLRVRLCAENKGPIITQRYMQTHVNNSFKVDLTAEQR